MRDENNIVYKSDNDHNPRVLRVMQIERSVKTCEDFIACLTGAKSLKNVNDRIKWQMQEELPEIRLDNGDPEPLVVNRIESRYREEEDEER